MLISLFWHFEVFLVKVNQWLIQYSPLIQKCPKFIIVVPNLILNKYTKLSMNFKKNTKHDFLGIELTIGFYQAPCCLVVPCWVLGISPGIWNGDIEVESLFTRELWSSAEIVTIMWPPGYLTYSDLIVFDFHKSFPIFVLRQIKLYK